jgi:hypothetical protein
VDDFVIDGEKTVTMAYRDWVQLAAYLREEKYARKYEADHWLELASTAKEVDKRDKYTQKMRFYENIDRIAEQLDEKIFPPLL